MAAREREADILAGEVVAITQRLKVLMVVEDEIGTRAARAYEALNSDPFIPTPVWTVALALAWNACGVIYGSERANRARFAKPLREVLDLVADITRDLRKAA